MTLQVSNKALRESLADVIFGTWIYGQGPLTEDQMATSILNDLHPCDGYEWPLGRERKGGASLERELPFYSSIGQNRPTVVHEWVDIDDE